MYLALDKISIHEYLNMVKYNTSKYVNYDEILILHNGLIELARPSHFEKLIQVYYTKTNIDRDKFLDLFPKYSQINPVNFICEKLKIISISKNNIVYGPKIEDISRFQKRVLDLLVENNILDSKFIINICTEYSYYLENKDTYNFAGGL